MFFAKFLRIFGYTASVFLIICGILLLSGYLMPAYIDRRFRIMMAVVMILYGIFRIATIQMKRRDESR